MNLWNRHDLIVMDTRDRMVLLKEEFDKKYGVNTENYYRRLNNSFFKSMFIPELRIRNFKTYLKVPKN